MNLSNVELMSTFYDQYPLKRYKKGHIFVLPGEAVNIAYYLVEGKVKVYDVSYRGDEIIITNRIPPAIFPLSFVVNTAPTRYIYEATTDTLIRQAPASEVKKFLDNNPSIVLELLSKSYMILDNVLERLVHYIASSAKNRLVYTILSECKEFGVKNEDGTYRIDVNEKELGARAGLSRETVSREARALKRLKLLEIHHHYMIVRHLDQLEKLIAKRT
ncbi:MAG: Crp/Fnr family transcriptional regulator [Candidatus Saccharimonadales bacterium]